MTFSGNIVSDYLKFANIDENQKADLINYSETDFYGYKRGLLEYIKAVYPLDYNNFIESDLGVMLIELIAYIGATTSIKADFLANENFIRTARTRNNVKSLLELIGVRMKGPISAVANAQITFETSPFSTVNDRIEIPAASRVIQITSPEDGGPLNFTLYKVVDGLVDEVNADGSIILNADEADNYDDTAESATVFSNLVFIEGALVKQTGEFTSNKGIKTIELTRSPVVEGSSELFIDGGGDTSGAYAPLDNIFFASGNSHKAYQVVNNDDFKANIVLGDGIVSKSPNAGDVYTVLYRVGGGSRGNIANEVINAIVSYSNLDNPGDPYPQAIIENITASYGGADAETVEHAKKYAPLAFRTQNRLVTLQDFKTFANTFIGNFGTAGKGTAAVRRAFSSANIIDLYILEKASTLQLKKASPTFKKQMLEEIQDKKMLTDEVVIVDGLIRTIDLVTTVKVDRTLKNLEETIKLSVRNKILNFFNVDNMDFGKDLVLADFIRTIYEVNEVKSVRVDNIDADIKINFNEILQLNNLTINVELI